jgi:hypothetical protein
MSGIAATLQEGCFGEALRPETERSGVESCPLLSVVVEWSCREIEKVAI